MGLYFYHEASPSLFFLLIGPHRFPVATVQNPIGPVPFFFSSPAALLAFPVPCNISPVTLMVIKHPKNMMDLIDKGDVD